MGSQGLSRRISMTCTSTLLFEQCIPLRAASRGRSASHSMPSQHEDRACMSAFLHCQLRGGPCEAFCAQAATQDRCPKRLHAAAVMADRSCSLPIPVCPHQGILYSPGGSHWCWSSTPDRPSCC